MVSFHLFKDVVTIRKYHGTYLVRQKYGSLPTVPVLLLTGQGHGPLIILRSFIPK
jgi:hypothetical protein